MAGPRRPAWRNDSERRVARDSRETAARAPEIAAWGASRRKPWSCHERSVKGPSAHRQPNQIAGIIDELDERMCVDGRRQQEFPFVRTPDHDAIALSVDRLKQANVGDALRNGKRAVYLLVDVEIG